MKEFYVVIAEHKCEEPLVRETYLRLASYDEAAQQMKHVSLDPRILRVALAKLEFVDGNMALFS